MKGTAIAYGVEELKEDIRILWDTKVWPLSVVIVLDDTRLFSLEGGKRERGREGGRKGEREGGERGRESGWERERERERERENK